MSAAAVSHPNKGMVILCYAIVYLVWGSTFFFIEKALHSFSPFVLGSLRFILAGSLLFTFCGIRGYVLWDKKAVKEAVLVGFILLFIDMAAVIWSEQYISSAIVSILSAACAIWFVVFDKPKWKENFSSVPTILGLVMGFAGVLLLFAEQALEATGNAENGRMKVIAMIVMVIGTIGWTVGSLISKYAASREEGEVHQAEDTDEEKLEPVQMHIMVKTAWQMLTAGVAFTLTALLTGEYAAFDIRAVATEHWYALGYLAVFGSILAFSSYLWLLEVRPATEVSTYAYINPIVAMLLVYFFTDHHVTQLQVWGLAIVLGSVLLMNWKMYSSSRTVTALRNRRFIKHLYYKSSIPRIIDLVEIHSLREHIKSRRRKNSGTGISSPE